MPLAQLRQYNCLTKDKFTDGDPRVKWGKVWEQDKLWRPKEVVVWCQLLPHTGIPGSFRNLSCTCVLCWYSYLSHEVFLLGQWQIRSCDWNPRAILSLSAAMQKINLAAFLTLLSALSPPAACHLPCTDFTGLIYPEHVLICCDFSCSEL